MLVEDKNKERNRYRSSFGATVLFSGVQFYQILIRIIKSKFIALFIGPAGMGIQSLLRSTTDTISAATNLGLNTSSVKTIASANREGHKQELAKTILALRRLILITGILGLLVCAALAPVWSRASFGNNSHMWSFVIVASIVLIDQLNRGELALLQGMQQKEKLAKANVIGQSLNALITIPLYYYYGLKAIVAAMVIGSIISLIISRYYSRKLDIINVQMTWKETFSLGREMIKLGFFLSLQFLMSTLVVWIIRNYVSNVGGIDDVGLYSAGTTIVTTYIGLVFAAMSTDYYPRLAATKGNDELRIAVRTQAELTILLLTPLAVAFMVFCKPVVVLLYSDKFLPIEHMMYWSISAVLLQAMGWAMSHTLLAKAKPSYFFFNELFTTMWSLPIKILAYKFWGLTGFGMATLVVFALYLVQVLFVTRKLFNLSYEWSLWKLLYILCAILCVTVLLKLYLPEVGGYVAGSLILAVTGIFVLNKLDQKMDLKSIIEGRFNKKK